MSIMMTKLQMMLLLRLLPLLLLPPPMLLNIQDGLGHQMVIAVAVEEEAAAEWKKSKLEKTIIRV